MPRFLRSCLLSVVLLIVVPAAAQAATITVKGTTLTFDAAPGETNTAVIVKQQMDTYFVGDRNAGVTRSSDPMTTLACQPTPPAGACPRASCAGSPGQPRSWRTSATGTTPA